MGARQTVLVPTPLPSPYPLESFVASRDLSPRIAPVGLTLPVPRHVLVAGLFLGAATFALGLLLVVTGYAPGGPLDTTVLQALREPLGWSFLLIGLAVVCAHLLTTARASVHAVAAVAHVVHCVALFVSIAFSDYEGVTVASVLSLFAWVAHGACSLDYWKRGYR